MNKPLFDQSLNINQDHLLSGWIGYSRKEISTVTPEGVLNSLSNILYPQACL